MSFVPTAGDILRFNVYCYNPTKAQLSVNNWDYIVASVTLGTGSYRDLLAGWDGVAAPLYFACLANSARYSGSSLTCLDPAPFAATVTSVINAGIGNGGPNQVADIACPLIKKKTALRGRDQQGRIFMPFPPTTFYDAGGLFVPATADVAYNALLAGLYGTDANGFVSNIVFTGGLGVTSYTLRPALVHRNPVDGIYTADDLDTVRFEHETGSLHKRGDFGKPNHEFVG